MLSREKLRSLLDKSDAISDEQLDQLVAEMYICAELVVKVAASQDRRQCAQDATERSRPQALPSPNYAVKGVTH